MRTTPADKYREDIIALLGAEGLPVTDLPASLGDFRLVMVEDELAGVAGLEIYGSYGLLRSLVVNKNFRNHGTAGRLLSEIEELARSKSIAAIYLLTESAAAYFERKGYDKITRADVPFEVQQSSEFSHVCPQSAIVMKKIIQTWKP